MAHSASMLPADAGDLLLPIARAAIEKALGEKVLPMEPLPGWLRDQAACFVTLSQNGTLRGCIGSIEAFRPLIDDLQANAVNAATRDPRFPALQRAELRRTDIEISVLSSIEPITFENESDALSQLRVGIDGIVFEWREQHGTFLPQVWEDLSDPRQFLGHLKNKAGLPFDFWAGDINLYRYTVSKWSER